MRIVSDIFVGEIETHILCSVIFFSWKSCQLWNNMEKKTLFREGHRRQCNTCTLQAAYPRLQNTNLLLFHRNNCYNESPQYNVPRTSPVLFTLQFSAREDCRTCWSLFWTFHLDSFSFVTVSI